MPISTLMRISPAVWLSPVLAVLAVLATSYSGIPVRLPEPYPLALSAAGTSAVFLVGPVCAACAAWEGGRLRRAGWYGLPHARSTITIALVSLAPVLLVGLMAVVVAVGFKFLGSGVVAMPDSRLIAKAAAIVVAHTLLGFALGVRIPVIVAVPSVLLAGYAWMVLPAGMEPLWLRHLNGTWASCCALHADLASQGLGGAMLVASGIAGSALLLMRQRLGMVGPVLSVVPVAVGFGAGAFLVRGLDRDPTVERDPALLVCSSGSPTVCVWPEHRGRDDPVSWSMALSLLLLGIALFLRRSSGE